MDDTRNSGSIAGRAPRTLCIRSKYCHSHLSTLSPWPSFGSPQILKKQTHTHTHTPNTQLQQKQWSRLVDSFIRQLVIVYFKLDTYLVLIFKVLPLLWSLLPGHFPLHPHFFQKKPTSQPTYSITTQTFSGLLSSTQKYQSRKQTQEWKDWTT